MFTRKKSTISSFNIENNSSTLKKTNESSKLYLSLRRIIIKSLNKIDNLNNTVKKNKSTSYLVNIKNKANNIIQQTNKFLDDKNKKYNIYNKLSKLHLDYIKNDTNGLLVRLKNKYNNLVNKVDNIINKNDTPSPVVNLQNIYDNNDDFIDINPKNNKKIPSLPSPIINYDNIYNNNNDNIKYENPIINNKHKSSSNMSKNY